jgi:hypothetical protein
MKSCGQRAAITPAFWDEVLFPWYTLNDAHVVDAGEKRIVLLASVKLLPKSLWCPSCAFEIKWNVAARSFARFFATPLLQPLFCWDDLAGTAPFVARAVPERSNMVFIRVTLADALGEFDTN